AVPSSSALYTEQWINWSANAVASIMGLLDGIASNETAKNISLICGMIMAESALVYDSLAFLKFAGDPKLVGLDLGSQLAGPLAAMNPKIPSGAKLPATALSNLTSAGLSLTVLVYTIQNPNAQLG